MQDLRIVLVIVGALAIAGLVIHGLWTNRNKNRNTPLKEKPLGRMPDTKSRHRHRQADADDEQDGFDSDGVGKVRVVSRRQENAKSKKPAASQTKKWSSTPSAAKTKVEPAIQLPDTDDYAERQVDIDPSVDDDVSPQIQPVSQPKVWNDFYQISVMAREGHEFEGTDLHYILTKLGFRFGEMDIFHRHLEQDGRGDVLFSMANAVKPGTFQPSRMAQFSTPGVTLFMELPHQGRAEAHFRLMVQAAEKMAGELDGLLMDRSRVPLSADLVEQYATELRAYDAQ